MNTEEIKRDLKTLNIEEESLLTITISEVNGAWRKAARKLHPDKAGDESTSEFQDLSNAYQRVIKFLLDNHETTENTDEDDADDVRFTRDNFANFNFPKQNDNSFVVKVQNDMANAWSQCLDTPL